MQMGYDFNEALPGGDSPLRPAVADAFRRPDAGASGATGTLCHPEWAGLRARFLAVHALRRSIPAGIDAAPPAGGFALASESVLSACRARDGVNPVYWANRKEDSVITRPVAASPTRGDRGMA